MLTYFSTGLLICSQKVLYFNIYLTNSGHRLMMCKVQRTQDNIKYFVAKIQIIAVLIFKVANKFNAGGITSS